MGVTYALFLTPLYSVMTKRLYVVRILSRQSQLNLKFVSFSFKHSTWIWISRWCHCGKPTTCGAVSFGVKRVQCVGLWEWLCVCCFCAWLSVRWPGIHIQVFCCLIWTRVSELRTATKKNITKPSSVWPASCYQTLRIPCGGAWLDKFM